MHKLEAQVAALSQEVHGLTKPISTIRAAAHAATAAVTRLDAQTRRARVADRARARAVAAAAATAATAEADAAAARAATAAAAATEKADAAAAARRPNERVRMAGLPPGWAAYVDRRTKYTYFYNARTRQSTWQSPAGKPARAAGLPAGWKAFRGTGGKLYYIHGRCTPYPTLSLPHAA